MSSSNQIQSKLNQSPQNIYSWGFSKYGQTSIENCQLTDEPNLLNIPLKKEIISISCGEYNSSFILKDNKSYIFGLNTFGQLGNDTNKNKSRKISFIPLLLPIKFKKLSLGGGHVLGLSLEEELYSWGLNIFGQLGLENFDNVGTCTLVEKFAVFENGEIKEFKKNSYQKVLDIKAGAQHSLILLSDGNIYSCGFAKFGALGYYFPNNGINNNDNNNDNNYNIPNENNIFTKIDFDKNLYDNEKEKITCLAAGLANSGCVINKKQFLLWGKEQGLNFDGIQKYSINDLLNEEKKEKKISGNPDIKKLEIGKNFAAILTTSGHVLTEGDNSLGQLGKQGEKEKIFFSSVTLPEKIEDISVGYETVYAMSVEKNIFAWGSNKFGQIPDLKKNFTYEPSCIMKLIKINPLSLSCGGYHVLALCDNIESSNDNIKNKQDNIMDDKVRFFKNLPLNKCFNADTFMKKEIFYDKINENFTKQQKLIDSIDEKEKECQQIMKEIAKKEKSKKGENSKDNKDNIEIEKLLDEEIRFEELVFPEDCIIGSGAFGDVKKAYWRKTLVSVKFLKTSLENKEKQIIPFIEEFNLLKQLRHPNILLYIGGNISGPQNFLVTEYCENGNLFELLHGKNAVELADSDKINLALEIAQGINYLHSFNPPILHRDLKSLNILLDKNYVVKIADFGSARLRSNHMTKLRGTFQWMAPEVISRENYTEKADVYSFGIILWELWSKDPPFKGIPAKDVGNKIKTERNYRPKIPEDVPEEISQLIEICWDFEPSNRPTFIEIINFLNKYLESIQESNE